ncbi:MAG: hypothetical protein C5B54_05320 [Acidobacteria bacterium]|nr:MAG: hypothetical protein C5B54_05320 [Acidobacteriota bacterium]
MAGTLARTLRTTEYFALAFGTMVGVGWLILIDDWLTRGGPAGAILGYFLGGLALIPVAIVYGRFVQEIPDAASELAYATKAFPSSFGYVAAWLMTLAYLIVCPWEAVAIGRILAYLIPSIQTSEIYRVGEYPIYLPALVLGLATTGLIVFLNYRGIRFSARFQNLTTFGLLALFACIILFGFTAIHSENYQPLFSHEGVTGSLISIVLVLQIVPYFLTGFESVPKCCEEAEAGFQKMGFMKAIFLGLGAGVVFYVLIIFVVSGLAPWKTLASANFATAVAFRTAFHSEFIVRFILAAALVSLLKVFNANFLTASRLVFALGRRGMVPDVLGSIHERFQSPHIAVLFCGVVTLIGMLLGRAILIPVTEVGSMCSALGWTVTCLAFARTHQSKIAVAWLGACVAFLFVLLKVIPAVPGSFGKWEYLALGVWLMIGFLLRRKPGIQIA